MKKYSFLILLAVAFLLLIPQMFCSKSEETATVPVTAPVEVAVVFTGDVGGYLRPCG